MGPQQLKDADDPFENKIDKAMWLCNKWSRRATPLRPLILRLKRNIGDIFLCQVWTGENKIRRKWSTGQQWLLQVCSKRLLILCFAEKKENATYSQLSSEIQSGEKPSLYYLIYFSCLRLSLFRLERRAKCWLICPKRTKGNFVRETIIQMKPNHGPQ